MRCAAVIAACLLTGCATKPTPNRSEILAARYMAACEAQGFQYRQLAWYDCMNAQWANTPPPQSSTPPPATQLPADAIALQVWQAFEAAQKARSGSADEVRCDSRVSGPVVRTTCR